jgi:hypothetical protein
VVPTAPLPALPHWEQTPADLPDAIRQTKAALRARIAASGRTVEDVFAVVQDQIAREVGEITAARERGEMIWPVIDFADIEAGTVPAGTQERLRRRGCLVVRGHFDREQALSWDRGIVDYVEGNGFFENYRGPGDDFFGSVGSRPEIYPIYWSPAQMQARQSDRMARVQAFLNSFWKHESGGTRWFDPGRNSLYPDRIRRRRPRNEQYAASVRDAFLTGSSPSDFPAEHYERDWANRFQPGDLNDTGRRGLGLN